VAEPLQGSRDLNWPPVSGGLRPRLFIFNPCGVEALPDTCHLKPDTCSSAPGYSSRTPAGFMRQVREDLAGGAYIALLAMCAGGRGHLPLYVGAWQLPEDLGGPIIWA
jgi:hypothetical protein